MKKITTLLSLGFALNVSPLALAKTQVKPKPIQQNVYITNVSCGDICYITLKPKAKPKSQIVAICADDKYCEGYRKKFEQAGEPYQGVNMRKSAKVTMTLEDHPEEQVKMYVVSHIVYK